MHKFRVLVVDDEPKIRELLASYLEHAGYAVDLAETGRLALAQFSDHRPHAVILDLMLPDITGEEVCRTMRRASDLPILMLTAKVEETALLQGFNIGADDYMTKPFNPKELVARIRALLRRSGNAETSFDHTTNSGKTLISPDGVLSLDGARCLFQRRNQPIDLTATEFRLMETFLSHPGKVFSRLDLVRIIWGDDFDGSERTVDAHIKNLRHKVEDESRAAFWIQTVHGFGYRLC